MILKKYGRIILSAIVTVGLCSLVACGVASEKTAPGSLDITGSGQVKDVNVVSKDVKVYWLKYDEPQDMTIYFMGEDSEIPYFEIEDFVAFKNQMADIEERESVITECRKEDNLVTLVRDNGSTCVMDFEQSTIHFDNFDKFIQHGFTDAMVSPVWHNLKFADGKPKYMKTSKASVNRNGYPITIDLTKYDIKMFCSDSKYYVPVQTMSDILITEMTNFIIYNGANLFVYDDEISEYDFDGAYYDVEKGNRSEELANFTYNEYCLAMDFNYGQQKEQNITDFYSYTEALGLKDAMLSENPADSYGAMRTLTDCYLGGRHNLTLSPSYLVEYDEACRDQYYNITSIANGWETQLVAKWGSAREYNYKDDLEISVPPYEEVGDTAILTFNAFIYQGKEMYDYYETTLEEDDLGSCYRHVDMIGLIQYAHRQITRPNSPIEKVVIDISNNQGGDVDAGAYLMAWIMGEAPISAKNPITGAETTAYYQCDANFDRVFDEKDCLKTYNKKVYCLVSPMSFSCANYVPCVLKETQGAILLGSTTGGGTCAITPLAAADGTISYVSGKMELCTVRNGAYYSVEHGVAPDYEMRNPQSCYNRENLVKILDELY